MLCYVLSQFPLTTWPWSPADWWPPADLLPALATRGQPLGSRSEYVTLTTWPWSSADWWLPTDLPSTSATRGKPSESGYSTHYFNRLTLVISWLMAASWPTICLGNPWPTIIIRLLHMLLWPLDLGHQLTDGRQLTYHPPRHHMANRRNQVT